jgi:hypothetical protein
VELLRKYFRKGVVIMRDQNPANQAVLPPATEDQPYVIQLASLLAGYTDANGGSLSVGYLSVSNGYLSAYNPIKRCWMFMPDANYNGQVTVSYTLTGGSATIFATKAFSVLPVNGAPVGSVTVSGTPTQNQTLPAANTLADVDGLGTTSYQWQMCTDGTTWAIRGIPGAKAGDALPVANGKRADGGAAFPEALSLINAERREQSTMGSWADGKQHLINIRKQQLINILFGIANSSGQAEDANMEARITGTKAALDLVSNNFSTGGEPYLENEVRAIAVASFSSNTSNRAYSSYNYDNSPNFDPTGDFYDLTAPVNTPARTSLRQASGVNFVAPDWKVSIQTPQDDIGADNSSITPDTPTAPQEDLTAGLLEPVVRSAGGQEGLAVPEEQPAFEVHVDTAIASNDPGYTNGSLWGMAGGYGSQADAAWAAGYTGSVTTVVGIIDTGIDYTHEDLYENIWLNQNEISTTLRSSLRDSDGDGLIAFYDLNNSINVAYVFDYNTNGRIDGGDLLRDSRWCDGLDEDGDTYIDDLIGWDFVNNDNDPFDDHYHGTHVAGTIGAMGDNGTGVAGVNWNVQMVALKFLSASGSGFTTNAARAIDYFTNAARLAPSSEHFVATSNSWGGGDMTNPCRMRLGVAHNRIFCS